MVDRAARTIVACLRVLAVFALFCASAQTNHRYFFCEAMGLMQTDPCGAMSEVEHDVAVTPTHEDCCRVVTLPSLPNATGGIDSAIVAAPFVGWVAAAPTRLSSFYATQPPQRSERGPPPPSRRQAELMIFLT